jgi:hypothetical protein
MESLTLKLYFSVSINGIQVKVKFQEESYHIGILILQETPERLKVPDLQVWTLEKYFEAAHYSCSFRTSVRSHLSLISVHVTYNYYNAVGVRAVKTLHFFICNIILLAGLISLTYFTPRMLNS